VRPSQTAAPSQSGLGEFPPISIDHNPVVNTHGFDGAINIGHGSADNRNSFHFNPEAEAFPAYLDRPVDTHSVSDTQQEPPASPSPAATHNGGNGQAGGWDSNSAPSVDVGAHPMHVANNNPWGASTGNYGSDWASGNANNDDNSGWGASMGGGW